MKNVLLHLFFLLTGLTSVFAQAPQKLSYQAVIRDASQNLVKSGPIGIRTSILQGSDNGSVVYQEIYNPNPISNINGLLTLQIGSGIPTNGSYIFQNINWEAGPFYIRTETDPTGGTNYSIIGAAELLSVPYALFAASGVKGEKGDKGDKGDAGTGVKIVGSLSSEAELPASYNGAVGDVYITQNTGHGWMWNGTSFIDIGEIKGPKGDKGDKGDIGITGTIGPKGDKGDKGDQGLQGEPGSDGEDGIDGENGIDGEDGETGPQGLPGPQGLQGPTGPQGIQGIQGMTGPQGLQGETGPEGPQGDIGPEGPQGPPGDANINGTAGYLIKFSTSTSGDESDIYQTPNGYIGIGTLSPERKFHVYDHDQTAILGQSYNGWGIYGFSQNGDGVYGSSVSNVGINGNSLSGWGTTGQATSGIGVYAQSGSGDGLYSRSTSSDGADVGSTSGTGLRASSTSGTGVVVSVTNSQTALLAAAGDLIALIGDVGIGIADPGYRLHLGSNSAAKPTSSAWTVASDARLKKDVTNYTEGLDELLKIHPVRFTYTGEAGMPQETGIGVLAQELQKVAPYMVSNWSYKKDKEDTGQEYLAVDNGPMTYMLINAVKEQQEIIETLRQQIDTNNKHFDAMQAQLDQLTAQLKIKEEK